jgi:hypothetical protein
MEGQRSKGHRYDVSGVQYAAAGDRRCAVIAAVGEVIHISILPVDSVNFFLFFFFFLLGGLLTCF